MYTGTVKQPKLQETSSSSLLKCIFNKTNFNLANCPKKKIKSDAIENLSRRMGTPLYIPLISIIVSFLLVYKKEKKYNFLKKYILFGLSFFILILAEILLKYTGLSFETTLLYFVLPVIMSILFYTQLTKKILNESII